MEDLSLHVLDIVENSLRAGAKSIDIRLTEDLQRNLLVLEVADDGEGMSEETARHALDPFFTTKRGKRVGLGLPLLAQAAEAAEGTIDVESAVGRGTKVTATFTLDHIDTKPLGKMEETVRCLRATHPDATISFTHVTVDHTP